MSCFAFSICEESLVYFKENVHKTFKDKCINCHGDDGLHPAHAMEDPEAAFKFARRFSNFPNTDGSLFVQNVFSRHWLEYDPAEQGMTLNEMKKILSDWYELAESKCSPQYEIKTKEIVLADDIKDFKSGEFTKLNFSLNDALGFNSSIELKIQLFSVEDNKKIYRLYDPIIYSEKSISIDGIVPIMNSKLLASEFLWAKEKRIINGYAISDDSKNLFPVLTTKFLFLTGNKANNKLYIAFNSIKNSTALECQSISDYKKLIPLMEKNNCLSCHGDLKSDARKRLVLGRSEVQDCNSLILRNQEKDAVDTSLANYILRGSRNHPSVYDDLKLEFLDILKKWKLSEFILKDNK